MSDILRDPIWQFVGVAISLVALVVAVVAIRFQLLKKSVSYSHAYEHPVFYLFNQELKERFRITFDGREVERLHAFNLHIVNNGNVPVLPADFVTPISIEFPQGSHIFGASATDKTPPNLAVSIGGAEYQYAIEPLLLNPGDEFTVQFLVERPESAIPLKPTVNARISGVKTFGLRPYSSGGPPGYPIFRQSFFLIPFIAGLLAGGFGYTVVVGISAFVRNLSGTG